VTPTVVVIGDSVLDEDVLTTAERLSPDGPVPVLDERERRSRPGGAALAARIAADSGVRVALITALGDDEDAQRLRALLDGHVRLCVLPTGARTGVKTRLRAGSQTVARLDRGSGGYSDVQWNDDAAAVLATADAVLVADYGRGVTRSASVRAAVEAAAARTPVVWDPHPRGGSPVAGCAVVTPNAPESAAALEMPRATGLSAAGRQAELLVERWAVRSVAVTVGACGAVLASDIGALTAHPVQRVVSGDACGAGDAFAAAASVALARGALLTEAVAAAVAAAGQFLVSGGVAALDGDAAGELDIAGDPGKTSLDDRLAAVRAAGGTVVATGGCFDLLHAGHIATLEAARALGDMLVVCLNSDDSVRALKGPSRPLQPLEDRMRVLQALRAVDAVVVFDESTPEAALRDLRPDVWVKGGDYSPATLPEADLVRSWGGQVVCVPYLAGRSTSELVQLARR
jgi:rfaE bifunctional protein nucleotidyltransferase chain/domain/rfaE bifunctional protein kinase chain/domain